jgi:hypothetical protein
VTSRLLPIDPDKYLDEMQAEGHRSKQWAYAVRRQKRAGTRPKPSTSFITIGGQPATEVRIALIDQIATLVDENIFGRHDMCLQFAALLERALRVMGIEAEARMGMTQYRRTSGSWTDQFLHAWVVLNDEQVVDGNADSLRENAMLGIGVIVNSFWGPVGQVPKDRLFLSDSTLDNANRNDPDVVTRWWPMLETWMREKGYSQIPAVS